MNMSSRLYPKRITSIATWLTITCLGLGNALAEEDVADPASRVARVSYLQGEVYTQTTDNDEWVGAGINQPLTSGDQLWTNQRGRAELQLGGTTLQIDADTQLQLLELSDEVAQIKVTQGTVNLRVRNLTKRDTVEIDTPHAAISVMESGTYRIEVAPDADSTAVQVRAGSADVASDQQEYTVHDYERLVLRGAGAGEFGELDEMDEFDHWAAQRNQRAERVVSSRYVGPGVIGYEDLDDYGDWRWYSDYGYVWMPTRIVTGWAPYRHGRWTWVSPWGWTWIDDAPWGFAPFHYGRWTTIGSRWCWVPGPRTARAVYAPALVAWIGTPGVSVSVRIGTQPVGWIPLGPREIYRPVYRSSYTYVTRVNMSNSSFGQGEFERGYRRQPHEAIYANRVAASVVHADALRGAQPVKDQLLRSPQRDLQPIVTTPVAPPEHHDYNGRQRITPPVTPNTRNVVARREPSLPLQGYETAGKRGDVRVMEPAPGPNMSSRSTAPRYSESTRPVTRGPVTSSREIPSWNSRTVTTSPSVRTDSNRESGDTWQRGRDTTPPTWSSGGGVPNAAPQRGITTEPPRVRNYSRAEETRSWTRTNPNADSGSASLPDRGRSVTVPAPMQRGEGALQTRESPPSENPSPQRGRGNSNDNAQQRGFRGESR